MRIFQSGINTLHIANSMLKEERRISRDCSLEKLIPYLIDTAYRRLGIENTNEFLDFCKKTTQRDNEFSVGILDAHGEYHFSRWYYSDGIIPKSVQKWVDENDGVYDLLLLHTCNPQGVKPIIRKSMAVVPTDHVSLMPGGKDNLLVMPNKVSAPFNADITSRLPQYNILKDLQPYIPSV